MNSNALKNLRSDQFSTFSWLILACGTVVAVAWYSSIHVVLQTALFGFTPTGMMHPTAALPNFAADFPNGEGEMMKSIIGRTYSLFGGFELPERFSTMAMVSAEAAIMLAGSAWLAQGANPHMPRWAAVAAALFVSAGSIASADFARWFHPYYGSVYNFAFGIGFAALAATLDKRLVLGGFLIGICAAVHPIIALFLGIAMGLAVLANIRAYKIRCIASGFVTAATIFGIWYMIAYRGTAITADTIDGELFTTLTRLMSSHWHPIGLDIFGGRAWEVLLPFCALLVVCVSVMALRPVTSSNVDRQLTVAITGLFLISLAGLWLSETSTNPVLIKLALHRASLVILLLAAIISVPRLIVLAVSGPYITAIVAAGLLLLPFWRGHGLPIMGAMLFGVLVFYGFAGPVNRHDRLSVAIAVGAALVVCLVLIAAGHTGAISFDIVSTLGSIATKSFVGAFALMIAVRFLRVPALAAVSVAIGIAFWAPQIDAMRSPDDRAKASSFLQVQKWASANTPPESVFMLDPVQSYAWRQYSQRPSFGTLREWLYSGWIYNTDPDVMKEGLRRAGLLGIGPNDFKPAPKQSNGDTYAAMVAKVRGAYATMDSKSLAHFAAENSISYFVFERDKRVDLSDFNVLFENERFAVVKPSR